MREPDNGPDSGGADFADSAGALDELIGRQAQIEALLTTDGFTVDPDGARRAAKACRDQAKRVEDALAAARVLARADNFGQCAVGDSLSRKFAAKAGDGPASMVGLLTQSRDLLARLATAYDTAAAAYDNTETHATAEFRNLAERTRA
ncbi:hypothetical protein [Actinokineospora iranica]|uniref:Excreted virulence factor EspC, type VII ESX diderm n=1 Tax=Actinokineospora iranica TaxID=1271860 RepID=A0A1G6XM46_9PSEU|nr:hypothetical protein [Actinokineospora iranica]SDD79294.1 hypothetical protein SAMN05216174_11827 [Actinokineospora iranica]